MKRFFIIIILLIFTCCTEAGVKYTIIKRNNLGICLPEGWREYKHIHGKQTIVVAPVNHEKIYAGDSIPYYYSPSMSVSLYKLNRILPVEKIRDGLMKGWSGLAEYKVIKVDRISGPSRRGYLVNFSYKINKYSFLNSCLIAKYNDESILVAEMSGSPDAVKKYSTETVKKFLLANFVAGR